MTHNEFKGSKPINSVGLSEPEETKIVATSDRQVYDQSVYNFEGDKISSIEEEKETRVPRQISVASDMEETKNQEEKVPHRKI